MKQGRRVWKKPCGIPAADAMSKTDALRNGGASVFVWGSGVDPVSAWNE
ncbi:hypothetical protein WCP94_000265 (plasmid) [Bilophila wadsworthia]